jgi:hypothetical protein
MYVYFSDFGEISHQKKQTAAQDSQLLFLRISVDSQLAIILRKI